MEQFVVARKPWLRFVLLGPLDMEKLLRNKWWVSMVVVDKPNDVVNLDVLYNR